MRKIDQTTRRLAGGVSVVAAIACALQVFQTMMWGIWGAPPNPMHPVALIGSFALFLMGMLSRFTGARLASAAALLATIPIWMFYGPTLDVTPLTASVPLIVFAPAVLRTFSTAMLIISVALPGPPTGWDTLRRIYKTLED